MNHRKGTDTHDKTESFPLTPCSGSSRAGRESHCSAPERWPTLAAAPRAWCPVHLKSVDLPDGVDVPVRYMKISQKRTICLPGVGRTFDLNRSEQKHGTTAHIGHGRAHARSLESKWSFRLLSLRSRTSRSTPAVPLLKRLSSRFWVRL